MSSNPRPKTPRQKAFLWSNHPNWISAIGETVFVRRTAGNLSMIRSTGKIVSTSVFANYVEVLIVRGRQRSKHVWHVTDLRPAKG